MWCHVIDLREHSLCLPEILFYEYALSPACTDKQRGQDLNSGPQGPGGHAVIYATAPQGHFGALCDASDCHPGGVDARVC